MVLLFFCSLQKLNVIFRLSFQDRYICTKPTKLKTIFLSHPLQTSFAPGSKLFSWYQCQVSIASLTPAPWF